MTTEVFEEVRITGENIATNDFIDLDDYYANRNVNRRMTKAHMKGDITSNAQRVVAIVELTETVGGEHKVSRFKIDGHSRTAAWKRGQLQKPSTLFAVVYHCTDMAQVHKLYKAYCSKLTSETAAEEGFHARKRVDWNPTSRLCNSSWTSAFKMLGGKEYIDSLEKYLPQLEIIDSWGIEVLKSRLFGVGTRAAMLSTMTRQGKEKAAIAFWREYANESRKYPEVEQLIDEVLESTDAGNRWNAAMKDRSEFFFDMFFEENRHEFHKD